MTKTEQAEMEELKQAIATMSGIQANQNRSLFGSVKSVLNSTANVFEYGANTASTVMQTTDSIASAGLIMADSNQRMVKISTVGKEQQRIKELKVEFPDLDMTQFGV